MTKTGNFLEVSANTSAALHNYRVQSAQLLFFSTEQNSNKPAGLSKKAIQLQLFFYHSLAELPFLLHLTSEIFSLLERETISTDIVLNVR